MEHDTPSARILPTVRLKPKAEARAIRHGFPWVYADELVTDRRTSSLEAGSLAVLEDGERRALGLVTVNVKSKIIARMLDRNEAAVIDQAWFEARLGKALALRSRLYDQPFYRLIHAEADGLPGVVIDRYGDLAVVQPNAAWAETHLDALVAALVAVTGVSTVVKNGTGRSRGLEGLSEETVVVRGQVDAALQVPMNGATYMADVLGGQKTGLFFDQRPNHAFAARLAQGATVLDVFSHVGALPWRRWQGVRSVRWRWMLPLPHWSWRGRAPQPRALPTGSPPGRAMPLTCWKRWRRMASGMIW